jgi:hypothetical protein
VNEILSRIGETYALQPRAVGDVLRSLRLQTCKLGNIGRGLRTTRQFTEQVHRLASDLGIKKSDIFSHLTVDAGYAGMPCTLFRDYGLVVQEDGKELRTVDPFKKLRERKRVRGAACLAESLRVQGVPAENLTGVIGLGGEPLRERVNIVNVSLAGCW